MVRGWKQWCRMVLGSSRWDPGFGFPLGPLDGE
jgi:hypothetical protein